MMKGPNKSIETETETNEPFINVVVILNKGNT